MHYAQGFYIEGEQGNNALDFLARREYHQRQRREPRLYVPPLKQGNLLLAELGEAVVFEALDEQGAIKACTGLKTFVLGEFLGKPAVLVDNHNHVFYFWFWAREQGILNGPAQLIHMDQHKDTREPEQWLEAGIDHLDDIFKYTNFVLNVGNYILPAQRMGLIGEVVHVQGSSDLEKNIETLGLSSSEFSTILNIDLDFFAPELGYIDFDLAKRFVQKAVAQADFITIATSPFFIDQGLALDRLKALLLHEKT